MKNTNIRTYNTTRNTFFAAFSYLIKIFLQFTVRAIFLRYLSVEYLGLNGLFLNVLSVLSLAELGVGNAIVYSMYKPIADNDTEKIKSLMHLYRNIYLIIGIAITILGIAIIPVLPYLIKDAPSVDVNLNIVYILYLAQTVIGYFFAYRRSLIYANQRNDIESKVSFFVQLLLAGIQICVLIFWKNYYAYVTAMVVCNLLDSFIIYLLSYKMFPNIRGNGKKLEKSDIREIKKNTGALIFHKLGGAVVFSTDSIIISSFIGIGVLGLYSNYILVTAALTSVVTLFCTATRSSIGNLIATSTKENAYEIFKLLNMILFWLAGFFFIGMICCFQDFISIIGGSDSFRLEFITVILICLSFYFTNTRGIVIAYKECAGLFWNDRFKPLFEAGINLGFDILLVIYMGLPGVIIATIISTVVAPLWVEPYVLFKNYFKKSVLKYYLRYLVYFALTLGIAATTYSVCYFIPVSGTWGFVIKIAICIVLPNILFILAFFKTAEFKRGFRIIKNLVTRK